MSMSELQQKCIDKHYLVEYRLELISMRENMPRSKQVDMANTLLTGSKISHYKDHLDMSKNIESIIVQLNKLINDIDKNISDSCEDAIVFEKETIASHFSSQQIALKNKMKFGH